MVDVTYFEATLTDEISSTYDPVTGTSTPFNQTGDSDRKGVEVSAAYAFDNGLTVAADYTWLDATDPNGGIEVRRPKNEIGLRAEYLLPNGKTLIGADLRHVSGNWASDFTSPAFGATRVKLSDYTVVNLHAQHQISDSVALIARVENLFDEDYEEVLGYQAPGRRLYAGVNVRF